jgi:hypothetical protein
MNRPDIERIANDWQAELPGLDLTPFVLSSLIQRIAQIIEQEFVQLAREYELRPGDLRVLLALGRSGPNHALSPARLFRELMVTSGGVSK